LNKARILIVCHANRFRSPLAEAFLRSYPHLEVRSAGFQRSGLRAGKPVREVARRLGFDLEGHRSTELSRELIDWADIVVVMNPTQQDRLAGRFVIDDWEPHLLGQYLYPDVDSIPDLGFIRGNTPEFERVVRMIEEACKGLARWVRCNSALQRSLRSAKR
jgi:protein-tyrosine phosphatase